MKKQMKRAALAAVLALAGTATAAAAGPLMSYDFNDIPNSGNFAADFRVTTYAENTSYIWEWCKYTTGNTPYYYARCYNWQKNAYDDYMTTTASVHLEPGHAYILTFDAFAETTGQSTYSARIAAGYGTGSDETAYTKFPEASVKMINKYYAETPDHLRYALSVEEAGDYYFTFKACGELSVGIDNILLVDGGSPLAPETVTALTVTPGADFAPTATLTMTLPSTSITGIELPSIDAVKIRRGDDLVATITEGLPAPGAEFTWADPEAGEGTITYTVSVTSGDLESATVSASAFVGPLQPRPVTNISVTESDGGLLVEWDAPSKSVNDIGLDQSLLTYDVTRLVGDDSTVVATGISDTEYTDAFSPATRCDVKYAVTAKYGTKVSDVAESTPIKTGPLGLPFADSFAGASFGTVWKTEILTGTQNWTAVSSAYSPSANPQDGDGGFASYNSFNAQKGHSARLYAGPFPTSQATNATVEFWIFHNTSGDDALVIDVQADGGEWTEVEGSRVTVVGSPTGWTKYKFPIQSYLEGSESFKVAFRTISAYGVRTHIDNVSIYNALTEDLELTSFEVPGAMTAGFDAAVKATVLNNGANTVEAGAYSVELTLNGQPVETQEGTEVAPGQSAVFEFAVPFDATHVQADAHSFGIKVVYAPDQDVTNNESTAATLVSHCGQPRVETISSTLEENVLTLTWAPAVDAEGYVATSIEETFAGLAAEEIDGQKVLTGTDWLMYDLDGKEFNTWYNWGSTKWMLFESTNSFAPKAQTGGKFIAVSCPRDKSAANDWLVSPELNPYADTVFEVAFTAGCNESSGKRQINVMYTTADLDPAADLDPSQFTLAQEVTLTGSGFVWTNYTATVPGVAKRVALVNVCENNSTYSTTNNTVGIDRISVRSMLPEVLGYNVYDDGIRHNGEAIEGTTYTIDYNDPDNGARREAAEGVNKTYHVTALYAEGESALSDPHIRMLTAVDGIDAETGISVAAGVIRTQGAATVYTLDGRIAARTDAASAIHLPEGIYIVSTPEATLKVAVGK